MSHIVEKRSEITNLDYIMWVCERLGLATERGGVPRYYYTRMGGQEAPRCDLVIKLPGKYDLGLLRTADGSYSFQCDGELLSGSFGQSDPGRQLLGDNAALLMQTYNEVKVEEMLMQSGISFTRSIDADGLVVYETPDPIQEGLVQG